MVVKETTVAMSIEELNGVDLGNGPYTNFIKNVSAPLMCVSKVIMALSLYLSTNP